MPDPNPIALWSVDRPTPLTLQSGRTGLQALLANGTMVKARIIAMLSGNVAQLEILGQKVEVSTPQALEAGRTISVAINRTGQGLELIIQPDANISRPRLRRNPLPGPGVTPSHQTKHSAVRSLWRFQLKIGCLRRKPRSMKRS